MVEYSAMRTLVETGMADSGASMLVDVTKPLVSFVNNEKKLPRNQEVSNIAFMNFMRNLTLDCGKGNPDAVGVKFIASNIGRMENVTIRTDRGRCGVYTMCGTQGVFESLEITGFDYGLSGSTTGSSHLSFTGRRCMAVRSISSARMFMS